jgi:uncharacterized protein (DUF362 family)
MATVVITQDRRDIGRAIDEALGKIPEIARLVHDRLVAVKPNETFADAKDRTGVTQPDALRAVLRYLKRFAPRELVVTGGSGAAKTDEVFRAAGLDEVVKEEGATFFDHNLEPFQEVGLEYGGDSEVRGPQKSVRVNPRVLEYDTLVSLAQLKLHQTATVTLTLKNIAMSFPAAGYYGYPRKTEKNPNHFFDDMHSFIAAMAKRFPIRLGIVVGHPAMIATGPLGGFPVETGLVIAGTDPVAVDAVGAWLLGFGPQAVRHLWEAGKLGLGETDTKKMQFPALSLEQATEAFTEAAYGKRLNFKHP